MSAVRSVIAEIGSNWLGRSTLALQHIREAAEAGAHGVKFQLFRAADLYDDPPPDLERFEMPLSLLPTLAECAHEHHVSFSVTPFSPTLAEALHGLVDTVKISAYDLTYDDLLAAAASLDVPVVLSTAMATVDEIAHALNVLALPPEQVTLLHGVAAYPAPIYASQLNRMRALQERWPDHTVGLSDHSRGINIPMLAIALGARHIEKHVKVFSPDIERFSPDAAHSLSARKLVQLTMLANYLPALLGAFDLTGPQTCELPLYTTCRRTNAQPKRRTPKKGAQL